LWPIPTSVKRSLLGAVCMPAIQCRGPAPLDPRLARLYVLAPVVKQEIAQFENLADIGCSGAAPLRNAEIGGESFGEGTVWMGAASEGGPPEGCHLRCFVFGRDVLNLVSDYAEAAVIHDPVAILEEGGTGFLFHYGEGVLALLGREFFQDHGTEHF
jgi:hypothetical protein